MYSRLARRGERKTRQQALFLIATSLAVLVLFILFGFPTVLSMAGTIGNWRTKRISTTDRTLAPLAPRFSQDFAATKSAQITLHGATDSKITVEIFQNERSLGTTIASEDGTFFLDVDLARGKNFFTALAISSSGQKSPVSDSYVVSYLASPPKLEVTDPKDGGSFQDNQVVVTGKSDLKTVVTINDHLVVVSNDGNFSYTLNLSNGDNKIKVVATDEAGNQTTKELKVTITTP